jgi:hypothetical protein
VECIPRVVLPEYPRHVTQRGNRRKRFSLIVATIKRTSTTLLMAVSQHRLSAARIV